jgi:hypothetical protein
MFGSLTSFKNQAGTDFGERMLNTVVSQSLRHLFTRCGALDVAIRCYPSSKLLQGSIDSFSMKGSELVIRRDFRVAEMSFETDAVGIDIGSAFKGQIRLRQPTQAVAQVILSEAAINDAFKADLVTQHLQDLDDPRLTRISGDEPISFRDIQLTLLPDQQVKVQAKTDLPNYSDVPISIRATLEVERRRRILFSNPEFLADDVPESMRDISEILSQAFAEILDNMVDLDRFNLDGVMMRINRLETQGQKLLFSGYAQIDHFPGT